MRGDSPTTRVSVVVVNYNGQRFLGDLFDSLAQQTRPADEVIMVDNASTDGSAEYTTQLYPWVHVVRSQVNVGFAEGNNIGVAHSRGEYIALLNPDTVAHERWLAELVRTLDHDQRIGAAVPKIYRASSGSTIEQAGAEFNNLGHCWTRGYNEPDRGQFDTVCEVAVLTGCATLLRRGTLPPGEPLFDGRFFMYYEEFDLSIRLRGRGYAIVYVPTAVVYHKGMQSVKRATRHPRLFQQFYCNRNRVKILAKYYPWAMLMRNLPLIGLSVAYWDGIFLRDAGLRFCLRAVAEQARYAFHGLMDRLRGRSVQPDRWLPWMTQQGLREILAVRAARGDVE